MIYVRNIWIEYEKLYNKIVISFFKKLKKREKKLTLININLTLNSLPNLKLE